MPFYLVKPEYTIDATLQSTNVAENDYATYSGTESYALNATVIYIDTNKHWVIRSLIDDNLGNIPTELNTDTNWVKISETNRWKMFDQKTTSQTYNDDSIEVTLFGVNTMDSIALLNLDGASVDITVTDKNDNEVYTKTESLVTNANVYDWYTYFFAPIIRKTDVSFLDIPPYAQCRVDVSVNYQGNIAKCGTCLIGAKVNLGVSRYGTKVSNIDYSVKEADDFGDFTIAERGYSRTMDVTAYVDKRFTDYTVNIFNQFRSTPVVWIATEEYSSSYIFGFYKTYEIDYTFPNHNEITAEIYGLS